MKIAKVFVGNPNNKKGRFNNILERVKHLKYVEPDVDCFMICIQYSWMMRLLKRQRKSAAQEASCEVNGIEFKVLYLTMGFFDYFITYKMHRKPYIGGRQLERLGPLFQGYDLLSVHTYEAVYLASCVKRKYNIPFVATWHGSDINFTPFFNALILKKVKSLLDSAGHNFFVSKKLHDIALKISDRDNKSVLYTGPAANFYTYPSSQKKTMRSKFNFDSKFVIGFVGNFVSVKNVLILPEIFKMVQSELESVSFVLVGDGVLEQKLMHKIKKLNVKNVKFLGKVDPSVIPDILNSMDVLLLPSFNEGLPRITLEALACGVHVVGSNRGGIEEAIGKDNCFELDDMFVHNISSRLITLLKTETRKPSLDVKFSWSEALNEEALVHKSIV